MGPAPTIRSLPTAREGRDVPGGDLLVRGAENDAEAPSPRLQGWCAAAVLLAAAVGVTAALASAQRAEDARALAQRAAEQRLELALRTDAVLVPRHRPAATDGPAQAAVHVEVVNTGGRTVRVLSGALTPGTWHVDVIDRREVRPGESLVLALHRDVDCSGLVRLGPAPARLVLTALLADDRPVTVGLDVAAEQAAYGGRLDDALRDPTGACSA